MVITAVGIGPKINDTVLEEIAGENGNVVHVDDFEQLLEEISEIIETACCK